MHSRSPALRFALQTTPAIHRVQNPNLACARTISAIRNGTALLALALYLGAGGPAKVHAQTPAAPARYSWQEPQAKVLPTGGLEWAPKPFVFEKGEPMRYIDFEAGHDAQDGKTPQTAWQHHPWDATATGEAKAARGIQTYVLKGGVVYRGVLKAAESGEASRPIRLTSRSDGVNS